MKFRKKPVVIDAVRWFCDGDHPSVLPREKCPQRYFDEHGHACVFRDDQRWIGTLEGGHVVSPGDWIITGVKGELYPVKDEIFGLTYEEVEDAS
jgi:hypothetical protein